MEVCSSSGSSGLTGRLVAEHPQENSSNRLPGLKFPHRRHPDRCTGCASCFDTICGEHREALRLVLAVVPQIEEVSTKASKCLA